MDNDYDLKLLFEIACAGQGFRTGSDPREVVAYAHAMAIASIEAREDQLDLFGGDDDQAEG